MGGLGGRKAWPFVLQPNGYSCTDKKECKSNCCVTNSYNPSKFCTPRTIFSQCVQWLKVRLKVRAGRGGAHLPAFSEGGGPGASVSQPNHDHCTHHKECRSLCCIRLTEASPPRCVPRNGLLAHCLPPVSASGWAGRQAASGVGGGWTGCWKDAVLGRGRFQVHPGPSGNSAEASGEGRGLGPGAPGDSGQGLPPPWAGG